MFFRYLYTLNFFIENILPLNDSFSRLVSINKSELYNNLYSIKRVIIYYAL